MESLSDLKQNYTQSGRNTWYLLFSIHNCCLQLLLLLVTFLLSVTNQMLQRVHGLCIEKESTKHIAPEAKSQHK